MERRIVSLTISNSAKTYKSPNWYQIIMLNLTNITEGIIKLFEKDSGQSVQELARGLKINRTFLANHLKALESERKVKSKRIGPAKVYFRGDNVKGEGK